jgi:integrase/recombinase XerD
MARRRNQLTSQEIAVQYATQEGFAFVDFDEAIDSFIAFCDVKNLREDTLQYYRNELTGFKKVLVELNADTTPAKITSSEIQQFIAFELKVANMKAISINTRLRAIRAFFNWLYREHHIPYNPVARLSLLKTKHRSIPTFSEAQLNKILQQPDMHTFIGVRDYTIMLMFIDTGIRANELTHVLISDIYFSESRIFVRAPKADRCRNIPISPTLKRQLHKYLVIRGSLDTDALFPTIDGGPLSRHSIQLMVHKYCKAAKIRGVRCSPHTFRHTFAKLSVINGANVFELQQILGHATLEMTKVYVDLFSTDVIKGHRSFSPLEHLNGRNPKGGKTR